MVGQVIGKGADGLSDARGGVARQGFLKFHAIGFAGRDDLQQLSFGKTRHGDAPCKRGLIFVIPFLGRVFLGDEALGFGAFGFAEGRFDQANVKGVLDALLDGGGRRVKINRG